MKKRATFSPSTQATPVKSSKSVHVENVYEDLLNSSFNIKNEEVEGSKTKMQLNELLTKSLIYMKKEFRDLSQLTVTSLGKNAPLYIKNEKKAVENENIAKVSKETKLFQNNISELYHEDESKHSKVQSISEEQQELQQLLEKARNQTEANDAQKDSQLLQKLLRKLNQREEELNKGITQQTNVKEIFHRTKNLLEQLWSEMHISAQEKEHFIKRHFYPESKNNYMKIFQEIDRLCHLRGFQHRVLSYIEEREAYLTKLKTINNKLNELNVKILDTPLFLSELVSIIAQMRSVTVALVEEVIKWRKENSLKQEFLWEEKDNYIKSMQTDLDFLKLTSMGTLFDFPMESNPLILPPQYRSEIALQVTSNNGASTIDFATIKVEEPSEERNIVLESSLVTNSTPQQLNKSSNTNRSQIKTVREQKMEDTKKPYLLPMRTVDVMAQESISKQKDEWQKFKEERMVAMATGKNLGSRKFPQYLFAVLPPTTAMLERVQLAEQVIFQEDLYRQYLESYRQREKAATVLQCWWRVILSRRVYEKLKYEKQQYDKRVEEYKKRKLLEDTSRPTVAKHISTETLNKPLLSNNGDDFIQNYVSKPTLTIQTDTYNKNWITNGRYSVKSGYNVK